MSPSPFASPLLRPRCYGLIARELGRHPLPDEALHALNPCSFAAVLIALEGCFSIPIDVDEAYARATIGGLIDLVEDRVRGKPRPTGANIIDLAAVRLARAANPQSKSHP
jgi:hypothetical protein